jgi:hypothetical protein
VELPVTGLSARIRVLRDITRDKQAQSRRAAAAVVSSDFVRIDDLATLLGVAEHGFELLFGGDSTIQIDLDDRYLFSAREILQPSDLPPGVARGLAGSPAPTRGAFGRASSWCHRRVRTLPEPGSVSRPHGVSAPRR